MTTSASQVFPKLWVGGKPPEGSELSRQADVLVLCAEEHQPSSRLFPGIRVVRCPLPDARLSIQEIELARQAGDRVAKWLRQGKIVIVTCQMGLNRSALVACIAMGRIGIRPSRAIRSIRVARGPRAMSNLYFPRYLDSIVLHHALTPSVVRPHGTPAYA